MQHKRTISPLYFLFESIIKKLYDIITNLRAQLAQKSEALELAEAEIRRLKNLPKKPKLKASELDKRASNSVEVKKRAGSLKQSKRDKLAIHAREVVVAQDVPLGWVLKGYKPYVIEDFIVRCHNICYEREVWQSPDGQSQLVAELPAHLSGQHFGATLIAYILHQYYDCCVSQPLIHQSLQDFGVCLSTGQINNILIENKDLFHKEKRSLLAQAIQLKEELRTDDTGARHRFKNGFCNCLNSDLFTYFTTTYSKSRINFLEILRLEASNYEINETALAYARQEKLSPKYYQVLQASYANGQTSFADKASLQAYFDQHKWTAVYALKTITEALLIGAIIEQGFDPNTLIHSDGAGQFNVFAHCLCWKHAERPLVKLRPYNEQQEKQLKAKKKAYWQIYQALKKYKIKPNKKQAKLLEKQFDQMCQNVLNFYSLNKVLEQLKKKKDLLLLVLKRPRASLHNNDSERDIREYVKRRKISAGTRSEKGRKARDTFLSLKKTTRKLGISFWIYLIDRLTRKNNIPPLSLIMKQKRMTANA